MKALIYNKLIRLYKHFLGRNPRSSSIVHDLDELICQTDNFINYIHFEYSVAILYNMMMSISSIFFLINCTSVTFQADKISFLWITIVSIIKLLETFPKFILIWQTYRIAYEHSNNNSICMRRLMNMIRSNIFYYNAILGYILLFCYTSYFLLIKRKIEYNEPTQLNSNINILLWGFFLRIIISFINYHFNFKYATNQADLENIEPYSNIVQKVDNEVLEMINSYCLTKENNIVELGNQTCCICINEFSEGEVVKVLPCNNKHIFHKNCIEKWLSSNLGCPTCRCNIQNFFTKKN